MSNGSVVRLAEGGRQVPHRAWGLAHGLRFGWDSLRMTDARVIDTLLTRRSSKPALLEDPGPTDAELETILTAAARVPDHRRVVPWRFVVFQGEARAAFGEVLARALAEEDEEPPSEFRLQTERERFMRAPVVIAVIMQPDLTSRTPEWEQSLTCGAVCFNLCLAANALGFGTSWLTEWYSYSPAVGRALGLSARDRIAGFVYIGTATELQPDRERPDLAAITSHWPTDGRATPQDH